MKASIYLKSWKYTESLSVKRNFLSHNTRKRGSLLRLIRANSTHYKSSLLAWNTTLYVKGSKQGDKWSSLIFCRSSNECLLQHFQDKELAESLPSLLKTTVLEKGPSWKKMNAPYTLSCRELHYYTISLHTMTKKNKGN